MQLSWTNYSLLLKITWSCFLRLTDWLSCSALTVTVSPMSQILSQQKNIHPPHPTQILLCDLNWLSEGSDCNSCKTSVSQKIRRRKKMRAIRTLWLWGKLIHVQQQNIRKYLNFFIKGCDTILAYKNVQNYIASVEKHTLAEIIWLDVVLLDHD